jgi:hypothetical protein
MQGHEVLSTASTILNMHKIDNKNPHEGGFLFISSA